MATPKNWFSTMASLIDRYPHLLRILTADNCCIGHKIIERKPGTDDNVFKFVPDYPVTLHVLYKNSDWVVSIPIGKKDSLGLALKRTIKQKGAKLGAIQTILTLNGNMSPDSVSHLFDFSLGEFTQYLAEEC